MNVKSTVSNEISGVMTPRKKSHLLADARLLDIHPVSIIKAPDRRSNKTVSFNMDESVKIYEPPIYLPNKVLTKELLREYALECEKLKTKFLEPVVSQLKIYDEIDERLKELNLRGCRLDRKSVEALEIIFMNVQFETINLESTMLDEDTCVSLCEMFDYYSSTIALSVGSNTRIGVRGWSALSSLIAKSSTLEDVSINRMVFTDLIMVQVSRAIRISTCIRVMKMESCYLNGPRLRSLIDSLTDNMILEELYLGENKINSSDCEHIGNMLKHNRSIRVLSLQNNPIQDLGFKLICNGLIESEFSQLISLQLWNANLTSVSMHYLALYLNKERFCNAAVTLSSVNLGKNKIGDEGLAIMKPALMQNRSIERLGLANSRLTGVGVIALAEVIAENNVLLKVDIQDNIINFAAILALSLAVQRNSTILKIAFNDSIKLDSGMEEHTLNDLLTGIKEKCRQNRELAQHFGKISDMQSLTSAVSLESHPPAGGRSGSISQGVSSFLVNIITSPWRLTKMKIFGSKSEASSKATPDSPSPKDSSPENVTPDGVMSSPPLAASSSDAPKLYGKFSPTLVREMPATVVASRFTVRRTDMRKLNMTHRRCRSDTNNAIKSDRTANSIISVNPSDTVQSASQLSVASMVDNNKSDLISLSDNNILQSTSDKIN